MASHSARYCRVAAGALLLGLTLLLSVSSQATMPPREGAAPPDDPARLREMSYQRSYLNLARRIRANRAAVRRGDMSMAAASAFGGIAISGTKAIPVLPARFTNSPGEPFPVSQLQTQLFDGPWPTGTMADYYREISYGRFTVNGTVYPWRVLSAGDNFYEAGCNGLCPQARTGEFLRETLQQNDALVNFSQYDNDGPDGLPNSGDDDGYVDFVAFVHPESGGECGNANLWSHRFILSGWGGGEYITGDQAINGGPIRIDDYVIMPALACDNTTMIQIGVFAHEFGHAFGLPDLYDTNFDNGGSEGIGNWGLMAGGSWGGDGVSPALPVHMSVWSREYLGWVTPTDVVADTTGLNLAAIVDQPESFRVAVSPTVHYLVANRQQTGFDQRLPVAGLAVWRIDEAVVNAGLNNNSVNADENNAGVALIQADGERDLQRENNRGDGGDLFPGSTNRQEFSGSTLPATEGQTAFCAIVMGAGVATLDVRTSGTSCSGPVQPLDVSLEVIPGTRLERGDLAEVRVTVTAGGVPVSGRTVAFRTDNASVARVTPAAAITDTLGVANSTLEVQADARTGTRLVVEVDSVQAETAIAVSAMRPLAVLALCVIALAARGRRNVIAR